jgi:hypothetical protein
MTLPEGGDTCQNRRVCENVAATWNLPTCSIVVVAMDLLIGLDGVLSYQLQKPSRPPAGCDNGSAIR